MSINDLMKEFEEAEEAEEAAYRNRWTSKRECEEKAEEADEAYGKVADAIYSDSE